MSESLAFWLLAALSTICSILVIGHKSPVVSAVSLVLTMFWLAGIYALRSADFLAVMQVMVYAGAIIVLFLFVVMLITRQSRTIDPLDSSGEPRPPKAILGMMVGCFIYIITKVAMLSTALRSSSNLPADNTYQVAMSLFYDYLWPFELASLLILAAIVCSILIAKKRRDLTESALQAKNPDK